MDKEVCVSYNEDYPSPATKRSNELDLGFDLWTPRYYEWGTELFFEVPTEINVSFEPLMLDLKEWQTVGGIIKDRSSVSREYEIAVCAGVIDLGFHDRYNGITVRFMNPGRRPGYFDAGQRIAQMVVVIAAAKFKHVSQSELGGITQEKRPGLGWGSTGK